MDVVADGLMRVGHHDVEITLSKPPPFFQWGRQITGSILIPCVRHATDVDLESWRLTSAHQSRADELGFALRPEAAAFEGRSSKKPRSDLQTMRLSRFEAFWVHLAKKVFSSSRRTSVSIGEQRQDSFVFLQHISVRIHD
ncbi:hypothetical protein D9M71_583140 [compost metagenome]